jgi:3-hydroxy-9,10-secoandrosta-1,3,5(10)-triene-9,17-dione monooxygenase reductase component
MAVSIRRSTSASSPKARVTFMGSMLPARVRTIRAVQAKANPAAELRKALGQFATGVTVVTTRAADGSPVGITVNSFSSVSLDPPLVLWCLGFSSAHFDVFRLAEQQLINVLAADQLEIAQRFATRGADRFAGMHWSPTDTGLPRLHGCTAWFECGVRSRYEEGDHLILVCRVESFEVIRAKPLIFHDSRYVTELTESPLPRSLRAPRG